MAEPVGIFGQLHIDEPNLTRVSPRNGRYRYDRDWDGGYEFEPLPTEIGKT